MSDVNVNPDEAAAKARQIIEADVNNRVEAVRNLADAANEADAAEQRLREATAAHERAWTAARNAGWSEKDLRATGVRAPGGSTPRQRKRRASAPETQAQ
ncbi:hypothetical protein [Mycetocola zhujimingii]|uniref:hypothetical protein n=1 Tax=Mycetocola zhujimingii TaxID=2079792 RepID=UPI000D33E8E0|nr:hypothetical protein [Mycetocola zhujimingii]AWB88114.1 hypothetical protein C3E77_15165 [Mycetocola zhujimingii]